MWAGALILNSIMDIPSNTLSPSSCLAANSTSTLLINDSVLGAIPDTHPPSTLPPPATAARPGTGRKRTLSLETLGGGGGEFTVITNKRSKKKSGVTVPRSTPTTDCEDTTQDDHLCVFCAETCQPTGSIQCDICAEHYHLECCSIPVAKHTELLTLTAFIGWTCRACRFTTALTINQLKQSVVDLKSELIKIRSSIPLAVTAATGTGVINVGRQVAESEISPLNVSHVLDIPPPPIGTDVYPATSVPAAAPTERLTYASALTLMTKTISDTERRKRNVIVTGLPESTNDVSSIIQLFKTSLQMNVGNSIVSTKRLGTENTNKYRRLLIVFNSLTVASDVYSRARLLRGSSDKYTADHIFINQDLSREESRLAYLRRVKRRQPLPLSAVTTVQQHTTARASPGLVSHGSRTYWNSNPPRNGAPPPPSPVIVVTAPSCSNVQQTHILTSQLGLSTTATTALTGAGTAMECNEQFSDIQGSGGRPTNLQ